MDNKYSIYKNENGKITWISIEKPTGEAEIKRIKNTNDNTKYMEELRSINDKHNDFFSKFFAGEITLKKASYFEKTKKQEQKQKYKEERKNVKENKESNNGLKKKIAALGTAAVLAVTAIGYAYGKPLAKAMKWNDKSYATNSEQNIDANKVKEENQKLKKIYEKLLKYENGKQIVKKLQFIDKKHEQINSVAIKNPDAKGKVSYITAEELEAISDVYNAQNNQKTLLENEDLIRCNYFTGQAALINLSQGSRDVQEIDDLFKDENLGTKQQEIQKETQKTLNNLNVATPGFINMLEDIYGTRGSNPELQSEVAFGQAGLAAALTDEMSGETLKNYQEASKTEGGQLSELITKASSDSKRAAVENNQINLEEQQLINKALQAIDNKRIADLDRTEYNPSTTEKGKDMVLAMLGDLGITAGGDYVVRTTTTHTTKKISRDEAEKIIGKKKLKELEHKVKVDTDGDGKNDTPLDEANKESKEEGTKEAQDRAAGYKAGQIAFTKGGPSTTTKGSKAYQEGYREGYQHAKSKFEEQSKEDSKKEENEFVEEKPSKPTEPTEPSKPVEPTTPTEPTAPEPEEPPVIDEWVPETTETTQTRQTVKEIKSYETNNENTIEMTMEDGTAYKSSYVRVRA